MTLPFYKLTWNRPKESPTQQQQQISRLLNRRKSLDPVRFREIKRELFGSEEFSLKLDDDQPPPPPPGFSIKLLVLYIFWIFFPGPTTLLQALRLSKFLIFPWATDTFKFYFYSRW